MANDIKSWNDFFKTIQNKEYCVKLHEFLDKEYNSYICYPPRKLLFNAFKMTPLEKIKVVIVGQDPYHEPGQAMGLSFSVPRGIKVPPSLINIYKEIEEEYGVTINKSSGDLSSWATQGVLLLNSILSVRAHHALSHNIKEYQMFLTDVFEVLNHLSHPIVFMLWGGPARKLKAYIHNPSHLVLECIHPSPLAANHGGWFGNNHFKKCNEFLIKNNLSPIDWTKLQS